ncbi:MAG: tRNA (adenosine(37)-N6)-threonylcarbamoyltransferase complex transferase subunit TsaD [Coriobacteriia bacterium]|nr:tRNA (adenosine(37)-N6)-threonylcarbamoyltransferase complex transferase subunit TsaD [Coriobacteriia bacterium]
MSARIRPMVERDLDRVLALERASFTTPWSRGMFLDELLQGRSRHWLVADSPWGIVGYAGLMAADGDGHIMNIAVRADARELGIGSALLAEILGEACRRGIGKLTLEVRPGNEAALGLYRDAGFVESGRRPGYYSDTGEDALIMWTPRLDSPDMVRATARVASRGAEALTSFRIERAEPGVPMPAHRDLILAIETSCDETAAAVLRDGHEVLSSVVASQIDFHARFGGVVPEIASRKHTEAIVGVIDEALERAGVTLGDLTALAVTYGPGLVGALVVGVSYAKGLSLATGLPLVGVNHLEGHLFANVLSDAEVAPPLVALVVSGGHTSLVHVPSWGEYHTLGSTLDDAAGEAFDKVAKALGLGYPGGPVISRLAAEGDPAAIDFPRAMIRTPDYDFSLSGLKTAVVTYLKTEAAAGREISMPDVAASFQQAVIDVQVAKAVRAVADCGVKVFCIGGGVAANPALRDALRTAMESRSVHFSVPPFALCTDNAAMIAAAAHFRLWRGETLGPTSEAVPSLRLDDI